MPLQTNLLPPVLQRDLARVRQTAHRLVLELSQTHQSSSTVRVLQIHRILSMEQGRLQTVRVLYSQTVPEQVSQKDRHHHSVLQNLQIQTTVPVYFQMLPVLDYQTAREPVLYFQITLRHWVPVPRQIHQSQSMVREWHSSHQKVLLPLEPVPRQSHQRNHYQRVHHHHHHLPCRARPIQTLQHQREPGRVHQTSHHPVRVPQMALERDCLQTN